MQIGGLQKLSLIDYPSKVACTIFLFGCNFRCFFCHNPELVVNEKPEKIYSEKEILEFLEKRKKYLEGVCITGGEPLINNDLIDFLKKIKVLNYEIKIDTNGSNPELLKKIIENKLVDYIAIDIKSEKKNYEKIIGVKIDLNEIEDSIKLVVNSGLEYEFRTTVIKGFHNSYNLKEIGRWISDLVGEKPKKYIIQNFVPRNKLVDEKFEKIEQLKEEDLEEMKNDILDYFKKVEIRV